MLKLAANLTMLFTELPFLDRFQAASEAGFRYVECLFPYKYGAPELAQRLRDNNLSQVLFNLPAGDWDGGARGIAVMPDRTREFREGVARALAYADVLDVTLINCLVGKLPEGVADGDAHEVLIQNLSFAATELARWGRTLLVEPINPHDVHGFYLRTPQQAADLIAEVGADNLKIQYDFYHQQRTGGQLLDTFRRHQHLIAHTQVADVPGRGQPGTGEIDYRFVLGELDRLGYDGYVGLEYLPQPDTRASLAWIKEHGLTL